MNLKRGDLLRLKFRAIGRIVSKKRNGYAFVCAYGNGNCLNDILEPGEHFIVIDIECASSVPNFNNSAIIVCSFYRKKFYRFYKLNGLEKVASC